MPDRKITVYNWPSPNGAKVLAALYEMGLAHEIAWVNADAGETRAPDYLAKVPLGKIPAITDPDGPGGMPITLCESGAILIYLAEKTGLLVPMDPAGRIEALQWVMWQMSGQGPLFGRLAWLAGGPGRDMEDRRLHEALYAEARRFVGELDQRLEERDFVMGDAYGIADIALWPWMRAVGRAIDAEAVGMTEAANVQRWFAACVGRASSMRAHETFSARMAETRGG